MGVKEIAFIDTDFEIIFENGKIYGIKNSIKKEIYVYPSMWKENNKHIPNGSIAISDKMIVNSMPKAYSCIRKGMS